MADVVMLKPRRQEPALSSAEVRLSACGKIVELALLNEEGAVEILEYGLVSPPDLDLLDRLCRAWDQWRGRPAAVS